MASILMLHGFRWHSDKPYQTRLRLVRYVLSECHLNPYCTQMDAICTYSWLLSYMNVVCVYCVDNPQRPMLYNGVFVCHGNMRYVIFIGAIFVYDT